MVFRFLIFILCGFVPLEAFSGRTSPLFFRKPVHLPPEKMCHYHAIQMEKLHRIPDKLLRAVSLIESGRSTVKGLIAWPWTINVKGKGHFFSTKQEAIVAVRDLQKKGVKSIDVGCMQINLQHHPNAFRSLEEAFDPATNVSYGATFLTKLQGCHGDWSMAVAHYHSATPQLHQPYQDRVLKTWLEEKKKINPPLDRHYADVSKHKKDQVFFKKPSHRQSRRLLSTPPSWFRGKKQGAEAFSNASKDSQKSLYWTNGKRLIRRSMDAQAYTRKGPSHVWSRLKKRP